MVTTVSTEKLASWLRNGKSVDDVFTRLQLAKAGDKLFDNPQFLTWLNCADDLTAKTGKEASAIATLTAHYGDDALAKILQAAKKAKGTEGVATRLEVAQIQSCLAGGNTADDVFRLLKLDKAGDNALSSPLFDTWNNGQEDRWHDRYCQTGRGDATSKWLGSKQTPDDVFKLLKLDNAADDVLANPALNTWTNYLKTFNKENHDRKTTLIAALTTHYGDEGVSKMLDAAKKVEGTKGIARNLETAQIQHWLGNRKSPDSVFKLLNLDKAGDNLLANPLFTTFTKFTDAYHAKNLGSKMTTGWIVRAQYDDFDVVKMILAAEKAPSSATAAKRMEGVLFKDWMAAPKAPDHVFEVLKLNQVGAKNLISDPMLSYWMKFLDDFNKAFPGKDIQRAMLTTTYKDQDLWKAIQAAKKNPLTKELGTKLQTEMLEQFVLAKKEPIDVAKLMNVKEKTDANWKLWKSYLKDFNKYHLMDITT